ncbi:MAG: SynChlorMet cassette radical SAM/SPASM protein ScmE [bacterium]
MKTPKTIDIDITNRCNLRCIYCSHFTSAGDVENDLPKEEWIKFFEELNRCAVISVNISGGEPFFRKDLKDIIEGIISNRMRFSITSNGTLITDEMAEFISSTGRCDFVQVSIDGSIPIVHDMFRGEGNFQKAINGIKILQKYNVPTTVRVTIHKQNVKDLENIAKFLLEDIGLPSFSTNSASYMGLCRQNSELVQMTAEERSIAMEKLLELSKKYGNRISASAGPLSEGRTWVRTERDRREGKKGNKGFLTGCGGPFTKLAVRADGVIVPCNQLSHIELGKINQDSIEDIWQNHPELIKLRERCNIPLSNFEFCQGCDYIEFCTGNCPALSYNLVGEVNHPSPDACLRRFLAEGGKLPDESILIGT